MSNVAQPIRILQTDFRAGEVSPEIQMRVDSKAYPSGARSLKNCRLSNTGAVSRRPGTTLIRNLSGRRRLKNFEYDEDEKYILCFGNNALEIYDAAGTLQTSFSGSTNCPWTSSTMFEAQMTQAADVMVITHKTFRPKVLRRTGLTTFSMTDLSFVQSPNGAKIYQPYVKYEAAPVTLAISNPAEGSGRTITASSGIFSSAWVGDTIRMFGIELTITGYTNTTTVTATAKKAVKKRLDLNPFLFKDESSTCEVTHVFHGMATGASVTLSGARDEFSVSRNSINGARTITVIDEDRYTFTMSSGNDATSDTSADGGGSAVEVQTTAPTRDWDEQVFSARRGWPSACCFHEDRLWFGGSSSIPDGLWSSHTGDYFNFAVGTGNDNESIQVSIGSARVANIRHIVSNRLLQIFTEGSEFVAKQSDGVGLTPSTVSVRPQTTYGCAFLSPKSLDGATMFLQANDKTIREFVYDFNQDGFQSADLTAAAPHLINTPKSFDVFYGSATRPEQYAFFVNGDGTMAVFHSIRQESLAAWTPWVTRSGDTFDSVVVLSTKVFVSVLRNGTYRLEQIEFDGEVYTDCTKAMTAGTATTSWALGSDYANQVVHVTSNDYYLGSFTANSSGTITLGNAVTSIKAGYNYQWQVIPNTPDKEITTGPLTGVPRRIVATTVHVLDTLNLTVDGRDVVGYSVGDDLSVAPPRASRKFRKFLTGYDRDPVVVFSQSAPLPVTLLGCNMEVSF
jgi:hypothetical protein